MEVHVHAKIRTHLFIVTLFVTTNSWEKIKYPSIGEWIKKNWWCSYTMKYQSEIKGTNY